MAEVEGLIGGALARVLADGRERFNARFAQARRTSPGVDAGAFTAQLASVVSPIADAVDKESPDRVRLTVEALYDLSLELVGKGLIGSEGSKPPALLEGWRRIFSPLSRFLAEDPRLFASSITNALYNISALSGGRPTQFMEELLDLGTSAPDVAALLDAGKVVAWRSGAAHFRPGALETCARLPAALASRALGLPDAIPDAALPPLLARLRGDPWLDPLEANREGKPGPLRIVAQAGGFRGFGGPFLTPPRVAAHGGLFYAWEDGSCWLLTADRFGATFHRAVLPEARKEPPAAFRLDDSGRVTPPRKAEAAVLPELAGATSWASTEATLAVTLPLSHKVFLVAHAG